MRDRRRGREAAGAAGTARMKIDGATTSLVTSTATSGAGRKTEEVTTTTTSASTVVVETTVTTRVITTQEVMTEVAEVMRIDWKEAEGEVNPTSGGKRVVLIILYYFENLA